MSVLRRLTLLTLPFFVAACNGADGTTAEASTAKVDSQQVTMAAFDKAELTARFSKIGVQVLNVAPADINGLVEVQTSGGVIFASPNGDHFLAGTLYSLDEEGNYVDVVAERQAPLNAEKIASFKDSSIEYKSENEKYVVTVFTDITCGYCVKLHSQMDGYNKLGITVRYMAYPRQGPTGQVATQMAGVWCAEEPQSAMHDAKVNRKFGAGVNDLAQCQQTISEHYNLGRELGISGTPAIFLPNGELVGGYLPPAKLLQRLEQIK